MLAFLDVISKIMCLYLSEMLLYQFRWCSKNYTTRWRCRSSSVFVTAQQAYWPDSLNGQTVLMGEQSKFTLKVLWRSQSDYFHWMTVLSDLHETLKKKRKILKCTFHVDILLKLWNQAWLLTCQTTRVGLDLLCVLNKKSYIIPAIQLRLCLRSLPRHHVSVREDSIAVTPKDRPNSRQGSMTNALLWLLQQIRNSEKYRVILSVSQENAFPDNC